MLLNRFGFAVLALACVVAAGTGGYLASRQQAVTPAPVAAAPAPAAAEPRPVQETEAIVGDTASKSLAPAAVPAPTAPAPSPSKRAEAPPRSQGGKADRRTATQVARAQSAQPPTLERSWPSGSAQPSSNNPAATSQTDVNVPRQEETRAAEAARPPEPPARTFEELVVAANSVIGLQMETPLSSETARVEDRVEARVTRDVRVGGQVAIPAGARAIGSVMTVDRGGKFKETAKLGIRFNSIVLADGTRLPITTETLSRDGKAPSNASASKVGGGAVAGTILGAILGGAKGAAVGAAAGAGGGAAAVMAGDRNAAQFQAGEPVTTKLLSPVTVTVEK
jgi:hypothetical protein